MLSFRAYNRGGRSKSVFELSQFEQQVALSEYFARKAEKLSEFYELSSSFVGHRYIKVGHSCARHLYLVIKCMDVTCLVRLFLWRAVVSTLYIAKAKDSVVRIMSILIECCRAMCEVVMNGQSGHLDEVSDSFATACAKRGASFLHKNCSPHVFSVPMTIVEGSENRDGFAEEYVAVSGIITKSRTVFISWIP